MTEFDLINTYFMRSPKNGDDAAIITPPAGHELLTSIDTSVEGHHYPTHTHPADIGYKSLAVSISDMAAMGAAPTACLLSLCIPELDEDWIKEFTRGFFEAADAFNIALVGGDITRGPRVISTTIFGVAPLGTSMKRSGAQIGDAIYVSGTLGNAGAALNDPSCDQTPLNRPKARVNLGIALRNIATSCIDISDGLAQDLGHILKESTVGARIDSSCIPHNSTIELALTAGDDYELCFTTPHTTLDLPVTKIGVITDSNKLEILDAQGRVITLDKTGYQHF